MIITNIIQKDKIILFTGCICMKKAFCIVLSIVLIFSSFTFLSFGAENDKVEVYHEIKSYTTVPLVVVRGDGNAITNSEDKEVPTVVNIQKALDSEDSDGNNVKDSIMNVIKPFLLQGALCNNWQPYYDALQKEISDLFSETLLDGNGDPQYGTNISGWARWDNDYSSHTDKAGDNGVYDYPDEKYEFHYDWRLDPLYSATLLNEYIENIKKSTGKNKVCVLANCLGTQVIMAYIAEYGTDSLKGIGMESSTVGGAEFLSKALSGNFDFDPEAMKRYLASRSELNLGGYEELIDASLDFLDDSGVFDDGKVLKPLIYYKLVKGVTSALALSTAFTYPSVWGTVKPEDYEKAKEYVFGKEGSEKRQQYAGLIEKIDNYEVTVKERLPELLTEMNNSGNVGIEVNYGFQMIPICTTDDELSDEIITVEDQSFGATCASNLNSTLTNDYIQKKISEGKEKYISPDKKIDASTCVLPDQTWFLKNCSHYWYPDMLREMLITVADCDEGQLTVDDFEYSQFMVYVTTEVMERNNNSGYLVKMTEENCNTEAWDTQPEKLNFFQKIAKFFKSLKKLITLIFNLIKSSKS